MKRNEPIRGKETKANHFIPYINTTASFSGVKVVNLLFVCYYLSVNIQKCLLPGTTPQVTTARIPQCCLFTKYNEIWVLLVNANHRYVSKICSGQVIEKNGEKIRALKNRVYKP